MTDRPVLADTVWSQTVTDAPPAAVLWDMDGTLVDTEPYWIECEFALAEKYAGTWTHEHALQIVGGDLIDSATYIREHMGIDRTPRQIVDELLDGVIACVQREVPWRPGARELLEELRTSGVPCALVTMSWTRFVDPILAELPAHSFAEVITGDQVSRGKPDPEPYVAAARALALEPSRCLAIEDSDTGSRSAAAAGCAVLVVPNHVTVPGGPGRVFRDSLTGLRVADLGALARAALCDRVGQTS